jgi:hypothetical protein
MVQIRWTFERCPARNGDNCLKKSCFLATLWFDDKHNTKWQGLDLPHRSL